MDKKKVKITKDQYIQKLNECKSSDERSVIFGIAERDFSLSQHEFDQIRDANVELHLQYILQNPHLTTNNGHTLTINKFLL